MSYHLPVYHSHLYTSDDGESTQLRATPEHLECIRALYTAHHPSHMVINDLEILHSLVPKIWLCC